MFDIIIIIPVLNYDDCEAEIIKCLFGVYIYVCLCGGYRKAISTNSFFRVL